MPTSRLEAFSDGVIAIAITLLVLEIKIPSREGASLAHALLDQWPAYLSYAVSFLTVGIIWVNHHSMFSHLGRADPVVHFLNLGLLMTIRREAPTVPVILMTAHGTAEVIKGALDLGAYRVISKPFEVHDMASLVAEALAAR